MDQIPNSDITLAIALLIMIWVFLVHMIMSQAPDAHMQFLLDLLGGMGTPSKGSSPRESSPCLADDTGTQISHMTARSTAGKAERYSAPQILREVPLLFATSLRGRGL